MSKSQKSILVLCCICVAGGFLLYFISRQGNQTPERSSEIAKSTATPTVLPQKTPKELLKKLDLSSEIDELIDEEIDAMERPPDLGAYIQGWDGDAQYEVDLLVTETFADTLQNMADWG
jgi:hypothetical protein